MDIFANFSSSWLLLPFLLAFYLACLWTVLVRDLNDGCKHTRIEPSVFGLFFFLYFFFLFFLPFSGLFSFSDLG